MHSHGKKLVEMIETRNVTVPGDKDFVEALEKVIAFEVFLYNRWTHTNLLPKCLEEP